MAAASMGNCNASLPGSKRKSQSDACSKICCVERGRRQDWCETWVPEWPTGRNFMNVLPCIVCLTASCVASAFQKASRRCRMIARTLLWRQVYLPCWGALEHTFSRCRSVHGLPQRTHEGSTSRQPQRRRFVGVGAVSVTAWRANHSSASLQL